jgi:tRNA A-37 threonylcarbamoyl transferase component Bud32
MRVVAGDADVGRLPTVLQRGDHDASGARLTAGSQAGEYVIDGYLGGGGMGEVYAGHHPVIGKKVAIKVIKRELAASPEAVARFTREARAVNQVDHANVVDVFALGRLDDGRLFLVMDLVDGKSLRARLADGPFAPGEALAVLAPIAAALDAAHARGVVHRDLKPDNVMVSGPADQPVIKVLDFGIAKLVSAVATDDVKAAVAAGTLTGQGTWLGTPAYMAPEQWSADGAVPASDRYAFAVMTYELLAGAPPFKANSVPALMEKHFRADVPSITTAGARTTLPAAVDAVLRRGMAKDPDQRFASAAELVGALRDAIGTQAGPLRRAAGAATTTGRTRRVGTLPMIAGGAGLAVTALGVWIVSRDGSARSSSPADRGAAVNGATAEVLSSPPGATIVIDGAEVGVTPKRIDVPPGKTVALEARKPGYLPQRRTVGAGAVIELALQPVDAFEGTWALPSGELRRFQRQGELVVALRLAAASEPGTYYRKFQFVASTGATVSFAAEEEFVDPRAPDEATCHVPLTAQYDYDTGGDELELRNERVRLDVINGRCVVVEQGWGDPQPLTRVDRSADTGTWAESRAGAGPIDVVANPASEPAPAEPIDAKPTKPRPKKRPKIEPPPPQQQQNAAPPTPPPATKGAVKPTTSKVDPGMSQIAPPPQAGATPPDTEGAAQVQTQKK